MFLILKTHNWKKKKPVVKTTGRLRLLAI